MKELNYQWYILSIRGGREEKIIEKIKSELESKDWSNYVREIKIISGSNKKNILKGYILVNCYLTSELTQFFWKISGVIGFLNHQRGDDKLPDFVSEEAIKKLSEKVREKEESQVNNYEEFDLNIKDLVKITEGVFAGREGRVIHLDQKKQKVRIVIEPSGWETTVPVNICQKILG